jgi:uncharacterized protein
MLIREMNREECCRVLAGARLTRLACAQDNQPYVVPIYLAYDEVLGCLYGFTTPGQKVKWMRANPLVCVEVDEFAADDRWVSVIGMGRYEELPETSTSSGLHQERPRHDNRYPQRDDEGYQDERERAWHLLKTVHPIWWEPGCTAGAARVHRDPAAPMVFIYFRIRLDDVTGHEATRDARDAISRAVPPPPTGRWGRLRATLMRLLDGS